MAKDDWFRRSTWSAADEAAFLDRLGRSRTSFHKAQYLRIQAVHLAEAGLHQPAIDLLTRVVTEFAGEESEVAQAHAQLGRSYDALGKPAEATIAYRAALDAERATYTRLLEAGARTSLARTNAWLDFGWFATQNKLTSLYEEVGAVFREFRDDNSLRFPANEFRYHGVIAMIAEHRGDGATARVHAQLALAEAEKSTSGLRYHPDVGLVRDFPTAVREHLEHLATGRAIGSGRLWRRHRR